MDTKKGEEIDQTLIAKGNLANFIVSNEKKEINMSEEGQEEKLKIYNNKINVDEYIDSKLHPHQDDEEDIIEIRQITIRMAKMWDEKGKIYEAIDLYKRLIKQYNGSKEASEAKKALTKYAEKFESEGRYHQAHSLYNDIFL